MEAWIAHLFENPDLLKMGHCQSLADLNLGMGWIYYGLVRLIRPKHVVAIGSWRGFAPLVLAKALADNESARPAGEKSGELWFIDPSLVDDFWREPEQVRRYFEAFGLVNVRHFHMTTQEFRQTPAFRSLRQVELVLIDGLHTQEQARFDFEAFEELVPSSGLVLLHDSCVVTSTTIYGKDVPYQRTVRYFIDELKADPCWQVLDLPFAAGLTLVRKASRLPMPPPSGLNEPIAVVKSAAINSSKPYLSICAIVKDEGPYLAEWVEYHRQVGAERFIIYDNNSRDNTKEVLDPYIQQGLVEYIHWPEHPGQLSAYNDCIQRWRNKSFWMAFVDLDEFVVPASETVILSDVLERFEGANGLGINTMIYGPSDHKNKPPGLQMENYLHRALGEYSSSRHIKTVVNLQRVLKAGNNPHYFLYQDGLPAVDEDGELLPEGAFSQKNKVKRIRINHFMTRSEDEFSAKLRRGRATTKMYRRLGMASRRLYHDLGKRYDPIMLRYAETVRSALEARQAQA